MYKRLRIAVTPRLKLQLISISVWHLTCLAMMFVYAHTIAYVVAAAYRAWFGDIQQSYETFARIATYIAIITITSPATLISLVVFDGLDHRRALGKRVLAGFLVWEPLAVASLALSFEARLPQILNQLSWTIFGPPENLYGFRNLAAPRILAWLLCTTPVALLSVWQYSESTWRFSLRTLLIATTLVAVVLGVIVAAQ